MIAYASRGEEGESLWLVNATGGKARELVATAATSPVFGVDGDTLFGLCDLGFGCPEMGSVSLAEIAAVTLPFGLTIERDLCFEGRFPLTIYADAARLCGGITEDEVRLEAAAIAIANENSELPQP